LLVGVQFGGYVWLHRHAALLSIPPGSVAAWVAVMLGVDFLYYWFHRSSHRVGVMWAAHAVHHQSEEYNLSVALRQSWLQGLMEAPFYWPLAVIGFPPTMFGAALLFDALYQFWIHTRAIGKLGPLEWMLNTPSHHRVHHATNPKYIDKNYAGIFIVWDRMFGTFHVEEEEPVYGTVKPVASWNPLWANIAVWTELWRRCASAPRLLDKVRGWFMPPEWRPRELGGNVVIPETSRATQRKYDAAGTRGARIYVLSNMALLVVATIALLVARVGELRLALACGLIVLTLVVWGGLLERRRWAVGLEIARVALAAVLVIATVR
jgi:alkylglycerol monooxygenase